MWRYAWYWFTTDDFQRFTIKGLKPFFDSSSSYLSWSYTLSWYYNKSTITVKIFKEETETYLKVSFTQKDNLTWEYKDFDYRIDLVSTPCNYWWVRWWFLCPCWLNRCSILYMQSNWIFASRKTLNLIYPEQKDSKRTRELQYLMCMNKCKAYVLSRTIKYQYRNWKPTRKLKRVIKLSTCWPTLEEVMNIWDWFSRKK